MEGSANAVARLRLILIEASKQDVKAAARLAWGKLFGLDPKDDKGFLHCYTQLLLLYQEAQAEIESRENLNTDLYLRWARPVGQALNFANLHAAWGQVKGTITDVVLQSLEYAADQLNTEPTEELSEEDLQKLQASVEQLTQEFMSSSLGKDVKTIVLGQLENVRQALFAHRIRGSAAVRDALERAFGASVLRQDLFKDTKQPPIRRFFDFLVGAYTKVAVVLKIAKDVEAAARLIGMDVDR